MATVSHSSARPTTYRNIVQRYVYTNAAGTHCQLSDGTCKYMQTDFNAANFLRHFRNTHPTLWKEIEQLKDNVDNENTLVWIPPRQSPVINNGSSAQLLNSDATRGTKRRLQANEDFLEDDHEDEAWLQTPSDDPASYCRLCFSIVELQPVFRESKDTNISLTMLIDSCTGIQLTSKTDYPSSICGECSMKLLEIQRFRRLCQTLNRVVRRTAAGKANALNVDPDVVIVPNTPPVPTIVESDTIQEAFYIDSPKNGGDDDDDDDIICISDEAPAVSNGPSAEKAEDTEEDLPYIKLQDNWFCCRLCNRIFETLATMMDHFQEEHKESVRVCNVPKENDSSKTITSVVIGGKSYFKCGSCDSLTRSKRSMTRHCIRFHNGKESKNDVKLPCPIGACDAFFMEKTGFRRHLQLIHCFTGSVRSLHNTN